MARHGTGLIDRIADRSAHRRWSRIARIADRLPLDDLRGTRTRARDLAAQLNRFLATAEERLTLPFSGAGAIRDALRSDWAWRPDPWRRAMNPPGWAGNRPGVQIGDAVKLFHDCPRAENAVRQTHNTRGTDLAPFGLRLEVFAFEGTFLSLAADIPITELGGVTRQRMVRLVADIEAEYPVRAFGRLNLRHGPNTEQLVEELPEGGPEHIDFDLGHSGINEARIEAGWVELIFEKPQMNQITVRDLHVCCLPRAEL